MSRVHDPISRTAETVPPHPTRRPGTRAWFTLAAAPCLVVALACGGATGEDGSASPEATTGEGGAAAEEPAYEPAYPEEVSEGGLTEEDVEGQAAGHEEAGHAHGEAEGHAHGGDGDDDH